MNRRLHANRFRVVLCSAWVAEPRIRAALTTRNGVGGGAEHGPRKQFEHRESETKRRPLTRVTKESGNGVSLSECVDTLPRGSESRCSNFLQNSSCVHVASRYIAPMNTNQIIELVSNNIRRCLAARHNNSGFLRRCDYKEIREIVSYLRSLKGGRA